MRHSSDERKKEPSLFLGMFAGAVGGLLGSLAMSVAQSAAKKYLGAPSTPRADAHPEKGPNFGNDSAATKLGIQIYRALTGHKLNKTHKELAEPIVHYLFGAVTGAAYGAVAEYLPEAGAVCGIPFGASVYIADEVLMPFFELSRGPLEYPLWRHLDALGTHCLYGFTTEAVRRGLRGKPAERERGEEPEFGMA